MTEISPGIHWLKLPNAAEESSLSHVNIYLFRGDNGYLLVDAGWNTDSSFHALHNYLVKNNLGFEDVSQIFVTHVHPDHFGMAGRIARLSGAPIAMHPLEQAEIDPRYVHMEELLHKTDVALMSNGMSREDTGKLRDASLGMQNYVVAAEPDWLLREGETVTTGEFTFRVIWTPGHSSGHLCLYEESQKILVAGDHVLPSITPNVSLHPLAIENPLGRYLESLKYLRTLEVSLVLPGHESPFEKLADRIDTLARHHDWRNAEIIAAMDEKPTTAMAVARRIRWATTSKFEDLPALHQRMAAFETMAHLDMMTADNKLVRYLKDGIIYYRQN